MLTIIPGIFEESVEEIEKKVSLVSSLVEWIQIDVSDGTMLKVMTTLDFSRFSFLTTPLFEAHLLVNNPEKYIRPLVDAGFSRVIAHIEAEDPRIFLDQARYESIEAGLAIDGATEMAQIEPFLEEIDCILVMMAEAGTFGLRLLDENIEKVRIIHSHYPDLPIEAEEGITDQTAKIVVDAGATRLVPTTYLFEKNPSQISSAINALRKELP